MQRPGGGHAREAAARERTDSRITWDGHDRGTTATYDANGNTLAAGAKTLIYDSQDRLTKFNGGTVTMVYDGDGTRVAKTSGGVTTQYLVDDLNPTGLPQVVEEVVGGAVARRYTYGINRISQTQAGVTSLYDYDAHGDVRALMSTAPVAPGSYATPTDTYDYDAFGNLIGSTGTTPNVYRYQGEALDEETGLYYFRARYYDPVAGRFLTVDPMADQGEPPYEYVGADPVNGHDPTGQQDAIEYALITAAFLLPVAVVPPPPDMYSCLGGFAFSHEGALRMIALVRAGCRQGGDGSGGQGGGRRPRRTYFLVVQGFPSCPGDCYRVPGNGGAVTREITYRLEFMEEGMPTPMGYSAVISEHLSGDLPVSGPDSPSAGAPGWFPDQQSVLSGKPLQRLSQTFTADINGTTVGLPVMGAFGGNWAELNIEKHPGYVSINGDKGGTVDAQGRLVPRTYTPCK